MPQIQLAVIGAGNMGEALLRGVLGGNVLAHNAVLAVEPAMDKRQKMARQLNVSTVPEIAEAAGLPAYLLAVKPQQMPEVLASLAKALGEDGALVISIAAGISTNYLAEALGGRARIVRAMPNTPMLVAAGCTGLCAGPGATETDLAFATRLFATGGAVHVVAEPLIDAVTAVSGSGPAYFFYLIEAMVAAGVAEGLEEPTALALARQTCEGAAKLLAESGEKPDILRRKVTSPGGTTAAAIKTLDDAGAGETLIAAVRAAAARSRELGK
jgi:pyrroline-5-carboxylate reductase